MMYLPFNVFEGQREGGQYIDLFSLNYFLNGISLTILTNFDEFLNIIDSWRWESRLPSELYNVQETNY